MLKPVAKFSSLVFAITMLTSCALYGSLKEPRIEVQKLQILGLDFQSLNLQVDCTVENPNSRDFTVDSIEYTVLISDQKLLQERINQKIELPANKKTSVQLPIKINLSQLWEKLGNLQLSSGLNYQVIGHAKVGLFKVPFKKEGTLKVP